MIPNSSRKARPALVEAVEARRLLAAASLVGTFTNSPAPPATMAGDEFATASYTVKNVGNAASTDFLPLFVLEQNTPAPGAGGDVALAEVNSIGAAGASSTLAAGKTATETLEFVLPANLSGTFYIVGEFSLSNYFASAPINVNGASPALTASFVAASVPATAAFGSTVTPQVQIANSGTAQATGQEVTDYFLSTSNDPNQQLGTGVSGVYFVGSSTEAIDLAPGQSVSEAPSLALPNTAAIPPGTYYLVAEANQGSPPVAGPFSSRAVAISDAIAVTPAGPGATSSLVPSLAATKLPAMLLSSRTTPMAAMVTIQNGGGSVSAGATRVNLYLSLTPVLDSSAVAVATVTRTLRIPASRRVSLRIPLHGVPAISNGAYYLLAQVVGPDGSTNAVASATTVNVAAPFVALAASLATPTANVIKAGTTLLVQNAGNISETTILDYTIGFSSDPNGVQAVGNGLPQRTAGRLVLPAGKTIRLHVSGWSKIVSGLAAGQYYLTVFVEDGSGDSSLAVSPTPVTVA